MHCEICKKTGHTKFDCWHIKRKLWEQKKRQTAVGVNEEETFAYIATQDDVENKWIFDTGASSHMTDDKNLLKDLVKINIKVKVGGGYMHATHIDTTILKSNINGKIKYIKLLKTLLVPGLGASLISWRKMAEAGAIMIGTNTGIQIKDGKEIILNTILIGGVDFVTSANEKACISVKNSRRNYVMHQLQVLRRLQRTLKTVIYYQ